MGDVKLTTVVGFAVGGIATIGVLSLAVLAAVIVIVWQRLANRDSSPSRIPFAPCLFLGVTGAILFTA